MGEPEDEGVDSHGTGLPCVQVISVWIGLGHHSTRRLDRPRAPINSSEDSRHRLATRVGRVLDLSAAFSKGGGGDEGVDTTGSTSVAAVEQQHLAQHPTTPTYCLPTCWGQRINLLASWGQRINLLVVDW